MDITWLVSFLTPYLPSLLGLGRKAVEKGAEKLGEKSAEEVWNKLSPQVKAKPAALEAAEDVAKDPNNANAVGALKNQLKKILEAPENQTLKAEIAQILEETKTKSAQTGKFNINSENSNIGVIGHQNKVEHMNFGSKP